MSHPRVDATMREHVIRAARSIKKPRPIQKWSCIVEADACEYELPVKQLLMEAANLVESHDQQVTPADFTAHIAARKLKKLGFEVRFKTRSGTTDRNLIGSEKAPDTRMGPSMPPIYHKPIRLLMREEMAPALAGQPGQSFTRKQAIAWFTIHYPKIRSSSVNAHLLRLSTNAPARINYHLIPSEDDVLFKLDASHFRLYDPRHDPVPIHKAAAKLGRSAAGYTDQAMITQEQFEALACEARRLEPMRFQLYDMGLRLIQSDYEMEAYLLILATWNFARFRYVTRTFDLKRFREAVDTVRPLFAKVAAENLETAVVEALTGGISAIYTELKSVVGQTGASKIMHFKQPKLFVMWDRAIRRHYRIPARCSAEDYVAFLRCMKATFGHLKWTQRDRTFAKAIDEYNFALVHGKTHEVSIGKGDDRMTISDALKEAGKELQQKTTGTITRRDLVAFVVKRCGCSPDAVLPADHCYNRENVIHDRQRKQRMFLFVSDGEYFYVGDDFNWVGQVERKSNA